MSSLDASQVSRRQRIADWFTKNDKQNLKKVVAGSAMTAFVLVFFGALATLAIHKYVGFHNADAWIKHQWQDLTKVLHQFSQNAHQFMSDKLHALNGLTNQKITALEGFEYIGLPTVGTVGLIGGGIALGVVLHRRNKAQQAAQLQEEKIESEEE